jgi:hypothetical protein
MESKKLIHKNPLCLNFSLENYEYLMYSVINKTTIEFKTINREITKGEGFLEILDRISSIKFINIQSIIDYCKENKSINMILIFTWINFLIFKDDFKYLFELNKNKSNKQIMGIYNLIEGFIEKENEEFNSINRINFFHSEIREMIIQSFFDIVVSCDILNQNDDITNRLKNFSLNIFNLNFDDAFIIIQDLQKTKEVKNNLK